MIGKGARGDGSVGEAAQLRLVVFDALEEQPRLVFCCFVRSSAGRSMSTSLRSEALPRPPLRSPIRVFKVNVLRLSFVVVVVPGAVSFEKYSSNMVRAR